MSRRFQFSLLHVFKLTFFVALTFGCFRLCAEATTPIGKVVWFASGFAAAWSVLGALRGRAAFGAVLGFLVMALIATVIVVEIGIGILLWGT
ncbi:MAG TPA: hypothetical protein VG826_03595 [Pirellulales bacterium]|nr:hypothetical protein [Pirellulales bacterium]